MNKYAQAALEAVRLYVNSRAESPRAAWDQATTRLFGEGTASQEKGCPRDAFLGLCEEGLVRGIPPGQYCKSVLNKKYAMAALPLLRGRPSLSGEHIQLWRLVMHGRPKQHNSQMDVVAALWDAHLIVVRDTRT